MPIDASARYTQRGIIDTIAYSEKDIFGGDSDWTDEDVNLDSDLSDNSADYEEPKKKKQKLERTPNSQSTTEDLPPIHFPAGDPDPATIAIFQSPEDLSEDLNLLLDTSLSHIWEDPPFPLQKTSTFFKFCYLPSGHIAIRHNLTSDTAYLIPLTSGTAYPIPPRIKPNLNFSLSFTEYIEMRKRQKETTGSKRGYRTKTPKNTVWYSVTNSAAWKTAEICTLKQGFDLFEFWGKNPPVDDLKDHIERRAAETPLDQAPKQGWWLLPVPGDSTHRFIRSTGPANTRSLEQWGTKYAAYRSPSGTFSKAALKTVRVLMAQALDGDGVSHEGVQAYMNNKKSRSDFNPIHAGEMGHYSGDGVGKHGLHLTSDLLKQKTASQTDALKRVMQAIRDRIAPVIVRELRWIDPLVFQFQMCVRQRVTSLHNRELGEYALDFGGAFFCVALSKGASQYGHIDRTDWPKSYAYVVPFGKYRGGDTVLPTLGLSVPVKPGQYLAFNANYIPHFCASITGYRFVATLFTDRGLAVKTRDVLLQMGISVSDLNFEGSKLFPPYKEDANQGEKGEVKGNAVEEYVEDEDDEWQETEEEI